MARPSEDKPESLRIVWTRGGYAVFVAPSAQPSAVFTSGYDLLDWVAHRVAEWETRQPASERPAPPGREQRVEDPEGEVEAGG